MFIVRSGSEISFSIETLNLPEGVHVYLEDSEANVNTDLDNTDYIIVLSLDSKDVGRFYLHTSRKALGLDSELNMKSISMN